MDNGTLNPSSSATLRKLTMFLLLTDDSGMLTDLSPYSVALFPFLYLGWKLIKRTSIVKAEEADLVTGLDEIQDYERTHPVHEPTTKLAKITHRVLGF